MTWLVAPLLFEFLRKLYRYVADFQRNFLEATSVHAPKKDK